MPISFIGGAFMIVAKGLASILKEVLPSPRVLLFVEDRFPMDSLWPMNMSTLAVKKGSRGLIFRLGLGDVYKIADSDCLAVPSLLYNKLWYQVEELDQGKFCLAHLGD